MIGPGRTLFNNFDDGTQEGQMIYWDNIVKKYKAIDITHLVWDESDKEFGIGSTMPNEPLHVQSDFDGNKGIRIQNESLGTSAVARFIADTSGGSGFMVVYGVNFTTVGAKRADCCAVVASGNLSGGLNLVAKNASAPVRIYAGGNTDADLQAIISEDGDLELLSKYGALILTRLTTAERDALAPANGMLIYNTSTNKLQGYENGGWVNLI